MSELVFTSAAIYFGTLNLSGKLNSVELEHAAELLDVSTFGDTSRRRAPGLKTASAGMAGFVDLADNGQDEILFNAVGAVDRVVSVVPEGPTIGNRAFFMNATGGEYAPGGKHGEVLRFDAKAWSQGPLVRGVLEAMGSKTATGNSTGVQLGAVGATQRLYGALHVLSAAGTTPSITGKIQSDDNSGFTTATDRLTFTATDVAAAEMKSVAGAITDDYWRWVWTISGTDPVFDVRALFGIL